MDPPSTLKPAEVAVSLTIQQAVIKPNTRYDKTFFEAVLASIMLSFGSLFYFIAGSLSSRPSLATSNPGIVKDLGGFVFPAGSVMYEVYSCVFG